LPSQPKIEDQQSLNATPATRVTVIIPALHRPDLTRRCLDSLQNQTISPHEFEVVVVENEARPDSILPDPLPRNVRRIELVENYGTTGSINRGVAASRSEFILLLNNDVELAPNCLVRLISAIEQDVAYGFVTGKLLSARDRTRLDGAGDALLLGGGAFRLGHGDPDTGQFDHTREILSGCGAATLFRRAAFEQAGQLDEDFFAYVDDVDLCLRTYLVGYRGLYVPDAVAYHLGSATFGGSLHPRVVEWITRNQLLMVAKDYPSGVLLRLLPRIVLFQVLWLGLMLRRRRLVPYVRGFLGALWRLPRMLCKRFALMNRTHLTNSALIESLGQSEKQVHDWYVSGGSLQHSRLLTAYFRLFPPSKHSQLS